MILLHLKGYPIFKQLQLEEALLRLDTRTFCIINEGSSPAIVMGISGKPEELVSPKLQEKPIPLIKRFSGGGTVVVDESTLFISFISQKEHCSFPCYPEPIMRWTEGIYREALQIDDFHLRENDYVIGARKCGGNAQYLRKERWLHHSTFLWDYSPEMMDYLLHPKKTPPYRDGRSHSDFLCRLKDFHPDKEAFLINLKKVLSSLFPVEVVRLEELLPLLDAPHRQTTESLEVLCTRQLPSSSTSQ